MSKFLDKNGNSLFNDVLLWSGRVNNYSSQFELSEDYTQFNELIFIVEFNSVENCVTCKVVDSDILPGCNINGSAAFVALRIWKNEILSSKSIHMNTYVCVNSSVNSGLTVKKIYGRY